MDKLDKILLPALSRKGLAGTATSALVCFFASKWKKIACTPISFSKGVLKVSVTSCATASELSMCEEELICFVNEKSKKDLVKKIRIINKS